MASPQAENGHTRIANEILEAIALCKFNGTQFRLLCVIWRYTYGYSRKEHELSVNFLAEKTGLTKRQVQKELNNLIAWNVVKEIRAASFNQTRIIAFNKDYEEWAIYPGRKDEQQGNENTTDEQLNADEQFGGGERLDTSRGERLDTSRGERLDTHIKQNIKQNIKQSSSSSSEHPLIDEGLAQVNEFYRQNLQKGVSESPFVMELIEQWEREMGYELVLAAMKISAKAEKRGFDYTEGILKKWQEAGVKTLDDARKYEMEFKRQKTKRNGQARKPIDWEAL